MRESRTYGSRRGACHETHVPTEQSQASGTEVHSAAMATLALAELCWCAVEPAFAQPARTAGLLFVRVHCSQCHAIDKVGESLARHRAAVPHIASHISGRRLAAALTRGYPSRDAPISAHAWSGVGYDGVFPTLNSLEALSSLSLKGASSRSKSQTHGCPAAARETHSHRRS